MHKIVEKLLNGVVISCQAYEDTPLYGSQYMAAMAKSAQMGGADGLRACWPQDIRAVKAAVRLAGPERVLFGTDFPLTVYPRRRQGQDFSLFIEDIEEHAGLTEAEWELVMGANMRRLLESAGKGQNR